MLYYLLNAIYIVSCLLTVILLQQGRVASAFNGGSPARSAPQRAPLLTKATTVLACCSCSARWRWRFWGSAGRARSWAASVGCAPASTPRRRPQLRHRRHRLTPAASAPAPAAPESGCHSAGEPPAQTPPAHRRKTDARTGKSLPHPGVCRAASACAAAELGREDSRIDAIRSSSLNGLERQASQPASRASSRCKVAGSAVSATIGRRQP